MTVREESETTRNLDRVLRWGTAGLAFIYAAVFFYKLMSFSWARQATGIEIDWTVPTNPQSMITLCLVTAGIAVWFLRDSGTVFAGLLFVVVLAFFGYWASLTQGIKTNMGVDAIPQVGRLGNFWIGANWLDVAVCLFSVGFLILNGVLLVIRHRAKQSGTAPANQMSHSHT